MDTRYVTRLITGLSFVLALFLMVPCLQAGSEGGTETGTLFLAQGEDTEAEGEDQQMEEDAEEPGENEQETESADDAGDPDEPEEIIQPSDGSETHEEGEATEDEAEETEPTEEDAEGSDQAPESQPNQ